MKAVIPAAKKKDSMFPFSESKPTGLMPVMGKPLVKHLIHALQDIGVDDIYIVTSYLEEEFEEEFGEYTNVNTVHQEELTGTAAAVATCDFIEEDFFVVNGDVLVSTRDLRNLKQKHDEFDSDVTMLATEEEQPEKFGVLSITNDKVVSIEEKPEEAENPLVNTGIYVFSPEVFDIIDGLGSEETSITDAVDRMVEREGARFEFITDYWIDIGSPRKLWKADEIKREYEIEDTDIDQDARIHDTVEVEGDAVIEAEAVVKPGAVLEGKVFIGRGAIIGPNTVISDSSVAKNSQVEAAKLEAANVFESVILDPTVYVEDSVIGEEVDVKPGTVIQESFIGARSYVEMNNSIRGVKFVPDARTDLSEISK